MSVGWEPHKARAFQARKLVLPNTELWAGGELAGGKEVYDVAGGDLGRAEIQGKLATVGKVVVGGAPRIGQGDGTQAPKAIEV